MMDPDQFMMGFPPLIYVPPPPPPPPPLPLPPILPFDSLSPLFSEPAFPLFSGPPRTFDQLKPYNDTPYPNTYGQGYGDPRIPGRFWAGDADMIAPYDNPGDMRMETPPVYEDDLPEIRES